ncbi:MAG: phosphoribosylformylglycinamidine synthase [Cyanobacteria bacterium NC_groundwater_1444_Ag_S-0.65um_54_12]|nr:phosphoribosylformylglycinamidine synthase [Cyanobacteria bacterium NC_groundwater_1444_Ag_S-0.65um_54_12]
MSDPITRIEVRPKSGFADLLARRAAKLLDLPPTHLAGGRVYYLRAAIPDYRAYQLAMNYLADPLAEEVIIGEDTTSECAWSIEVGLRPGVTDNEGRVASEILAQVIGYPLEVYFARHYRLKELPDVRVERALVESYSERLGNSLIEQFRIAHRASGESPLPWQFPAVGPVQLPRPFAVIELPTTESELLALSQQRFLALSTTELRAIRDYLADPAIAADRVAKGLPVAALTDVELEAIAQTWSEHCKHKVFNDRINYRQGDHLEVIESGLFNTYIRGATQALAARCDWLVSVFEDNAGVIRFDDDYLLTFKVETHNSPSALEPYGGALTGICGVNRDPAGTGLGCKLIFNTDVFCLAPPDWSWPLPEGVLHPARILAGVRKGVEDGGNQSGIPTVNGAVFFDERFLGRPLVFCGTGGLMPKAVAGSPAWFKQILPGDLVVMVGGRVGRDGIHGATFSSDRLSAEIPASVVQIGDPITQKRALDFLGEAREAGLYRAITDNGAGGLSSSVGELARLSGGCEIMLDVVPLKMPGLEPWEILVSESQERMTLAVPPRCWDKLAQLATVRGVEVSQIGTFTDSGQLVATWLDKTVASLDLKWLHETGLPRRTLEAEALPVEPGPEREWTPERAMADVDLEDQTSTLLALLGSLNICSREGLIRQYDHEVQGGLVVKPLVGSKSDGPADAAVLRPRLDSDRAIAISNGLGCCPEHGDPYRMAVTAVDEAIRNAVAVGADPDHLAILDNFCWPDPVHDPRYNPDGKYKLGALVQACRGLHDASIAYGTPLISGKDSVKNDFLGRRPPVETWPTAAPLGPGASPDELKLSIPYTLLISAIGIVPSAVRAVTMDFKLPGDLIYLIGLTRDERGGTQWAKLQGMGGGVVPMVDALLAKRCYRALHQAMQAEMVTACHDVSDGGLAVALAECALAGEIGSRCDLSALPGAAELAVAAILFSESAGRLLVTIAPEDRARFEALLTDLPVVCIGQVIASADITLKVRGRVVVRAAVERLKRSWQETPQW